MGLLDLFHRPSLVDGRLGELRYWRGWWTTPRAACFGTTQVEVRIPGNREGVSSDSRALFESVELAYSALRSEILAKLWAHYEPYSEAVAEMPEAEAAVVRGIHAPEDLWTHATLVAVTVNAYGNIGDTELRYRTLGGRVKTGH